MVGLYKDPDGKEITFKTTLSADSITESFEKKQMKHLKRRVTELELSLTHYVNIINYGYCHGYSNCYSVLHS